MDESETIADGLWRDWAEAFNAWDLDRLMGLYADGALFFGSTPELRRGRADIRDYFEKLPPGMTARTGEHSVLTVTPDIIAVSGAVDFYRGVDTLPFRLSFAVARLGRWQIFQHHGSPR